MPPPGSHVLGQGAELGVGKPVSNLAVKRAFTDV